MRVFAQRISHAVPFVPLLLGIGAGTFLVIDPLLSNMLAKMLDVSIGGTNIFKLYPYEITSLFFLFSPLFPFIKRGIRLAKLYPEKVFIALFTGGMHITSLTTFVKADFSELVMIVFFLVFLLQSFVKGKKLSLSFLDILNIAFSASVLISFMNAGLIPFIVYAPTLVKFILILFLFLNFIPNKEVLVFSLKCIVALTCISSFIGIGQELIFKTTGLLIAGVIDKKNISLMFEITSEGPFLRIPAFFGTYKPFTFFLTTALLLVFNYFIYHRPVAFTKRVMLIFSFFLMTTALLLTFSKDGLLSLFVGLLLSLFLRWSKFTIHSFFCVLIAVIALYFSGILDDIRTSISTNYHWGEYRIRLQLAREGILGFIHRHPFIGAGVSDVYLYTSHFLHWATHNSFIEAADAVGIVGLFFYIVLLSYSFYNLIKASLRAETLTDRWVSRGLLSGFISYMVTIQFHPFFYERFTWFYMGIINAYIMSVKKEGKRPGIVCESQS